MYHTCFSTYVEAQSEEQTTHSKLKAGDYAESFQLGLNRGYAILSWPHASRRAGSPLCVFSVFRPGEGHTAPNVLFNLQQI